MNLRLALLIACLYGCMAMSVHGQALTPEDAVQLTLQEHGLIDHAEARAAAAEAAIREARGARLPAIRSQASYTRLSGNIPSIEAEIPGVDTTFTIAPVEVNRYYAEISVEQPLFTGTRLTNMQRAAAHRAEAAEEGIEQEQARAALEARQAYWSLYRDTAHLEALDASREQIEAHVRNVENRVTEGAALRSHLLAAQTRRSAIQLDLIEAENDVRSAELELRQLIGLQRNTEIELNIGQLPEAVTASPGNLIAEALDDHPELNALRQEIEALDSEARIAQNAWMPEASLTGRYAYARPNQYFFAEQDRFRPSWEAGVVLRWDLWEGGRRGAQRDQAEARLQGERAQLEYLADQIELEITRHHQMAEGARQAVEVARESVEEAEESFRVATHQYETGAALSSEVLEAEAALQSARAREAEAIATYATARATLLHAIGRIW